MTGLITNVGGLGVGLSSELNSLVWNHVCFVADSNGSGRLYINGVLVSTVNGTVLNNVRYMGDLNIGRIWHSRDAGWGGKLDDIAVYNRDLSSSEIQQLYTQGQTTYLWSTGETTATINPTPTATTTYWCDITANGVTCRKEITITVNPNTAPTASANQTFCTAATIANLTATGTDVKWYATANDVTALAPSTTLISETYYASQTVNGCESTRTAVTVAVNDAQISASATTVCSGTAVTITAQLLFVVEQLLPLLLQRTPRIPRDQILYQLIYKMD